METNTPLPDTIAVDGPAGSGKSTVSFTIARRLGYLFVDTGAFYRAITLLAQEQCLDFADPEQITALARRVRLEITPDLFDDGRQYTILADGRDITQEIHSPTVESQVSIVAAIPGVRTALLDVQREIAAHGRVIMAGRDIGTVVLPNADLKIYIDAGLAERAKRRHQQRVNTGDASSLDSIQNGLSTRDSIDSTRDVAPLVQAPDAVYLDTSNLTLEQTIEAVHALVRQWSSRPKTS